MALQAGPVSWGMLGLGLLLAGCSSKPCQDLCTSYYEMELRCQLFGHQTGQLPSACTNRGQTIQETLDYASRQCSLDFRYPTAEQEVTCCKSVCFQSLVDQYDEAGGGDEAGFDGQRQACETYHTLVADGQADWCTELQSECLAELETDATSPTATPAPFTVRSLWARWTRR